jgi:hypothetical protein
MFESARLRWRLRRWERRYRADEEGTDRAVREARARGASQAEIDVITGGSSAGVLRYKVRQAMSNYLVSEADRLLIPLPDDDDEKMWTTYEGPDGVEHVLTRKGINEVRTAIRTELKGRTERFLMLTSGTIGVIGAITGLVSVVLR